MQKEKFILERCDWDSNSIELVISPVFMCRDVFCGDCSPCKQDNLINRLNYMAHVINCVLTGYRVVYAKVKLQLRSNL